MNCFYGSLIIVILIMFFLLLFYPKYYFIDSHTRGNVITGRIEKLQPPHDWR